MGRDFNGPAIRRRGGFETKPLKNPFDDRVLNCAAEKTLNAASPQLYDRGLSLTRKDVDNIPINCPAGHLLNERGRTIAREACHLDVSPTLEAIRRLSRQA